jgi:hypothetical protein
MTGLYRDYAPEAAQEFEGEFHSLDQTDSVMDEIITVYGGEISRIEIRQYGKFEQEVS